jgi:hypothetical protein
MAATDSCINIFWFTIIQLTILQLILLMIMTWQNFFSIKLFKNMLEHPRNFVEFHLTKAEMCYVYGKVKYVGTKAKDGWNYFICCCIVWL